MGMLHRDVKVRYERLARLAQILEHFVRHSGGVKIHEAQAFEALQRQEAVEQSTEILLAVEITPPFREILRHEIQFLDPLIQQGAARGRSYPCSGSGARPGYWGWRRTNRHGGSRR